MILGYSGEVDYEAVFTACMNLGEAMWSSVFPPRRSCYLAIFFRTDFVNFTVNILHFPLAIISNPLP